MAERFLPLREVIHRVSLSRSQIYRLMVDSAFPKPIPLGARKAWLESEIIEWQNARIAERAAA